MFGGLLKSTSRLALVAAAATVVGGVAAQAADLGGNCCADLEERVAELEATTARKGNRKMSLTVYGQVNKTLVWHDSDRFDAFQPKNVTVRDNDQSQSRFGFRGSANVTSDFSVSYNLEVGFNENFGRVTGGDPNPSETDNGANIKIRHNVVRLTSKALGTVWLGQTSTASDGAFEVNLANIGAHAAPFDQGVGRQFLGAAFGSVVDPIDGTRRQSVGYVSPTFAGFTFSASAFNKDQDAGPATTDASKCQTNQDAFACATDTGWDVALRYAGEFSGFRLAAAIAYRQENDTNDGQVDANAAGTAGVDAKVFLGSGSIMHVPTGLFISGGYGQSDFDQQNRDRKAWWGMAGIQKNWFGIGNTTLYGEYGSIDYKVDPATRINANDRRDGDYYGFGLTQSLDAAATDLYVSYRRFSVDGTGAPVTAQTGSADASLLTVGAIVRF